MRNSHAAILMLISIAAYASYPVAAVFARGEINPLLFVGVAHITAFFASAIVLIVWGKIDRTNYLGDVISGFKSRKSLISITFGGATNAVSHVTLFAAIYFAPPAIVTLLYETWPILAMFLFYFFMRRHYRPLLGSDYIYSAVAFAGLFIVVFSGSDAEIGPDFAVDGVALGIALALISSVTMAVSSGAGIWTTRFYEQRHPSLPASFMVQLATKLISGFGPLLAALVWGGGMDASPTGYLIAVGAGIFVVTIGASFYLVANTVARSSSINILYYLTPVASLILLSILGLDTVGPAVALGAILIIASNLLIYGRADPSYAYTASLLTLMASATFVYYFPGLAMVDFYDAVSVPGAIFAILIAFMLDRVFQRTNDQEQMVISMIHNFNKCSESVENPALWVIRMWKAKSDKEVHDILDQARAALPSNLVLDLYGLGLKKMAVFSFGEKFIILTVGAMVVSLINIFRPNTIVADLMAPALSSAVVFLTFTIFDRIEARTSPLMQSGLVELIQPSSPRTNEQMTQRPFFSSILIVLIFISYIYVVLAGR